MPSKHSGRQVNNAARGDGVAGRAWLAALAAAAAAAAAVWAALRLGIPGRCCVCQARVRLFEKDENTAQKPSPADPAPTSGSHARQHSVLVSICCTYYCPSAMDLPTLPRESRP